MDEKELEKKLRNLEHRVALLTSVSLVNVAVIFYVLDGGSPTVKILSTALIIVAFIYLLWEVLKAEREDGEETQLCWALLRAFRAKSVYRFGLETLRRER